MKNSFAIAILVMLIIGCKSSRKIVEDPSMPKAAKLVEIIQTQDFSLVQQLVKEFHYRVYDSSVNYDKGILYYVGDLNPRLNKLSCAADSTLKVVHLGFQTYLPDKSENIRQQLLSLGFESSGSRKQIEIELLEVEDFIKDNIKVTRTISKKGEVPRYNFEYMLIK